MNYTFNGNSAEYIMDNAVELQITDLSCNVCRDNSAIIELKNDE